MKSRCHFFVMLLLSSLTFMALAQANDLVPRNEPVTDGSQPLAVSKILPLRQAEMARLDTNGDKQLEVAELNATIPGKFAAIDTNGDKVIDDAEIQAYIKAFEAQYASIYGDQIDAHVKRIIRHFQIADANNGGNQDGKISYAEYSAYMLDHYQQMDRNADGIVSLNEFRLDFEKL